jgi:iron complex outermembrane recepter protein
VSIVGPGGIGKTTVALAARIAQGNIAADGATSWLAGTRFTLGAINVFNEEPAFVSDGFSFYNSVEDPRQRVLYLQIRRSF